MIQSGTVIFEDVSTEKRRGKILKLLNTFNNHSHRSNNPLSGIIIYETIDGLFLFLLHRFINQTFIINL